MQEFYRKIKNLTKKKKKKKTVYRNPRNKSNKIYEIPSTVYG